MASSLATALCITSDIWVLLKGDKTCKIEGAASRTATDVLYYDGSTYPKIVDAAMLGNAHTQTALTSAAQTQGALLESLDVPDPDPDNSTIVGSINGPIGSFRTATGGVTYVGLPGVSDDGSIPSAIALTNGLGSAVQPIALSGATTLAVQTDSAFRVGADDVVPGNTEKTRTLIQWWDNENPADPTAKEVAAAWADQIIEWGPNQPVFVE